MISKLKSEKGSALIFTIILVTVISVIAAATTSSMIRSYNAKHKTLSNEQSDYINYSCVEYTKSYLTKLLNTSFTYVLYNDHESPPSDPPFTDSSTFDGAITKYNPPATDLTNPYRRPLASDAKYTDPSAADYDPSAFTDDYEAWYEAMETYAVDTFNEYLGYKFDDVSYALKCDTPLRQDLASAMLFMKEDSNNSFAPSDSAPDLIQNITATITSDEDDFEDGILHVKFHTTLSNGETIVQNAKYKWNAEQLLKNACHDYVSGTYFTESLKIESYYEN